MFSTLQRPTLEELERRREEIEAEVLRRVEEAKKVMEAQMLREIEKRKQEQLEEARKREVGMACSITELSLTGQDRFFFFSFNFAVQCQQAIAFCWKMDNEPLL